MERSNRLFIFGLGYSARVFARRLAAEGWAIAGTRRSGGSEPAIEGCRVFLFGRGQPLDSAGLEALSAASHVLCSVTPDEIGDPVLDHHRAAIAKHRGLA